MAKVLLNDCVPEVSGKLSRMLQEKASVTDEPFDPHKDIADYNLVVLYADGADDQVLLHKVKDLHLRTKFRNIPIILVKESAELYSEHPYFDFGVSEFMSLEDPEPVFRHILQGYLNPGRRPLEREMVYLSPFIESTCRVMHKMAALDADFKGVYFKNNLRIQGDVSGIIGLSGKAEGTVVITFRRDLAQDIISRIMGVKPGQIKAETIHDGVGEIINMIAGSAKKALCKASYDFQLSLPTIIVGHGHEAGCPENAPIAVILFDVGSDAFVVNVSLSLTRA